MDDIRKIKVYRQMVVSKTWAKEMEDQKQIEQSKLDERWNKLGYKRQRRARVEQERRELYTVYNSY